MLLTELAAVMLAGTTLATSGCGESSKTTSNTNAAAKDAQVTTKSGNSLANPEFISRANAICARVNTKRAAITITSPRDYVSLLLPLATYEQAAATEMSKLNPPAALAGDWQQVVAGNRELAASTAKVTRYAKAKDLNATHKLIIAAGRTQQQITSAAQRDGLIDCAKFS